MHGVCVRTLLHILHSHPTGVSSKEVGEEWIEDILVHMEASWAPRYGCVVPGGVGMQVLWHLWLDFDNS